MTPDDTNGIKRRTVLRSSIGTAVGMGLVGAASTVSAQEGCDVTEQRNLNDEVGQITLGDPRLPLQFNAGFCLSPDSPYTCTVQNATLTGPDTDEFSIQSMPSLPATVEPGECFEALILFTPTSAGEKEVQFTTVSECVEDAPGSEPETVTQCEQITATVSPPEEPPEEPPVNDRVDEARQRADEARQRARQRADEARQRVRLLR